MDSVANDLIDNLAAVAELLTLLTLFPSTDPVPALRRTLREAEGIDGVDRNAKVDWDAVEEMAPQFGGDTGTASLAEIARVNNFWARLVCRVIPRYDAHDPGVFAGDNALIGHLQVHTLSLARLDKSLPGMGCRAFAADLMAYAMHQAQAHGTMIEEGSTLRTAGDAVEDWDTVLPLGLTRDQFVGEGEFPHSEDIYETIRDQVRTADSVTLA